jgi:hypothetical protein
LFLPEINHLLDGKKTVIREEKLEAASLFINKIRQLGSPPLQTFLDNVQKQLLNGTIMDMFNEIAKD